MDRRREPDAVRPEAAEGVRGAQAERPPTSIWTKFVSTRSRSTGMPAATSPSANARATRDRRRAARRGGRARRRPPRPRSAWRIAPPKRCFSRQARSMSSVSPRGARPAGSRGLREAERDRVEPRGDLAAGDPLRDGGIEQARAVEVNGQPELARNREHRVELVERPDAASRVVVRVLEREERRPLVGDLRARSERPPPTCSGVIVPATPGSPRVTSPACAAAPPYS